MTSDARSPETAISNNPVAARSPKRWKASQILLPKPGRASLVDCEEVAAAETQKRESHNGAAHKPQEFFGEAPHEQKFQVDLDDVPPSGDEDKLEDTPRGHRQRRSQKTIVRSESPTERKRLRFIQIIIAPPKPISGSQCSR